MTRTIHGIDPYAPGGLTALMAHHYATFGDAVMEEGAGGEGSEGSQGGQQEQGGTEGAGTASGSGEGQQQGEQKNIWDDPAAARAEIEKLRKQNGDERINAKNAAAEEARNELLKKLGLTKEGEAIPDPAKLAADLAAEREAKVATARELAIFKAAAAHGADPAKLLDSNSFMTSVKGLDPADGNAVSKAIKAAVTANQSLKAARAAAASGVELSGGSGEQGQITEQQLKTMTPEQISTAFDKGQLKNLLG
jgi:hypothetical protein